MQKTQQKDSLAAGELASALADGELRGVEFAQALDALRANEEGQARWHTYHLVGDVLRSGAAAAVRPHDAASRALRAGLHDSPHTRPRAQPIASTSRRITRAQTARARAGVTLRARASAASVRSRWP